MLDGDSYTQRPTKPQYRFSGDLPSALAPLRPAKVWLTWEYLWNDKSSKYDKPPCDARSGMVCGATDPAHWGTFDEARKTAKRRNMAGVGLAIRVEDDLTGIDLDDCRNPATGEFTALAREIISYSETYAEISPSGEGIRVLAKGKLPKSLKDDSVGVELYVDGRYLTITGQQIHGTPDEIRSAPRTLTRLVAVVEEARERRKRVTSGKREQTQGASFSFFQEVNGKALATLDGWVPKLLPPARKQATGGWRVSSADLGRKFQEDLSIHPSGIQDFGPEAGLTPIDLVLHHGGHADAVGAALWLCEQMRIEPAALGWSRQAGGGGRRYGHNSGATEPLLDDPTPLFRALPEGSDFPIDALGGIIGPAVLALHESAVQAPLSMCAAGALAAAAISTQIHANVLLPHGEVAPLSLFLLVVAESGERKSSLHKRVLEGVAKHTRQLEATYKAEITRHRIERVAWEAEQRLIATDKKITNLEARRTKLAELGPEPLAPRQPFLMVKEPTMQGLEKVMIAGQPSVGLFTSEAGEFLGGHAMGKERITGTLAKLNSLWDGEGVERIRAGEEAVICRDRRLSLFFQVQPHLSAQVLTHPIVRDIGFLSRLLICRPESAIGTRLAVKLTDEQSLALLEFSTRSFRLLQRPAPFADDGSLQARELVFTNKAAQALSLFNDHVERESREGGAFAPIRGFASKLGQHVARLAGVMLLFEDHDATEIGMEHLQRGIDIGQFYASEALRLQGVAEVSPDLLEADTLREWLLSRWKSPTISVTEIVQYGPGAIRDSERVRELLTMLEANGFVGPIERADVRQPNGEVKPRREARRIAGRMK